MILLLLRQALHLKPDDSASPQAECIQMGPGEHTCACQAGWTGDGWDCSAINNCVLPTVAGCHQNATCIYIGPGQVSPLNFIATFGTSLHPVCSASASYPVSSPNYLFLPNLKATSTWCSLPKAVSFQFLPQCSLPPTWWCSGSKRFLVSTSLDVRYKGLLEILISVIPLKSMEPHRNTETNSPCLEYVHYVNHFNKLLCFIEMTERLQV